MKFTGIAVGLGMLIASTAVLADDRAALQRSLEAANVSYITSEVEARGGRMTVLTSDNVCEVLAEHPAVDVSVYNAVTGEYVDCK